MFRCYQGPGLGLGQCWSNVVYLDSLVLCVSTPFGPGCLDLSKIQITQAGQENLDFWSLRIYNLDIWRNLDQSVINWMEMKC